jgi:hypothetical protein
MIEVFTIEVFAITIMAMMVISGRADSEAMVDTTGAAVDAMAVIIGVVDITAIAVIMVAEDITATAGIIGVVDITAMAVIMAVVDITAMAVIMVAEHITATDVLAKMSFFNSYGFSCVPRSMRTSIANPLPFQNPNALSIEKGSELRFRIPPKRGAFDERMQFVQLPITEHPPFARSREARSAVARHTDTP